jgi:hypothetical protein
VTKRPPSERSNGSRPSNSAEKLNTPPPAGSNHTKKSETKQTSGNQGEKKNKGKVDDKDVASVASSRVGGIGFGKKSDKDDKSVKSIRSKKSDKLTTAESGSTHLSKSMDGVPGDEDEESLVFKHPPKTLMLIWAMVGAELVLDLVTTIISFKSLVTEGECCGESINLGRLPLGITIPFFLLILLEMVCLLYSIKLTLFKSREQHAEEEKLNTAASTAAGPTGTWRSPLTGGGVNLGDLGRMPGTPKHGSFWFRIINWLVMLNPFFGFMVAWMLLYSMLF